MKRLVLAALTVALIVPGVAGADDAAKERARWNHPGGPVSVDGTGSLSKARAAQEFGVPASDVALAASSCYWATGHVSRGLWPYSRAIYQQTNWCGNGSWITYRATNEWPDTGWACSPNWGPESWKSGGGVGYWNVDVTTRGGFTCNIYGLDWLTDYLQMTIRFTAWGSAYGI